MNERAWRELISRKKKRLSDIPMFTILLAASVLYGAAGVIRALLFALKILKPSAVKAKIISIGNITAGGTGKTPFTEELAKRLCKAGKKIVIVAKGYKRKKINKTDAVSDGAALLLDELHSGDEAFMLARSVDGAAVVVSDDKIKGIEYGVFRFRPDIVILDDGFQKRRYLPEASQIVLIDCLNPFGYGRLLPAGTLRESPSALKYADAVVLTNTNIAGGPEAVEKIKEAVLNRAKNARIFEAEHQPKYYYNIFTGEKQGTGYFNGKRVVLFSSLGNPAGFERTIKSLGAHPAVSLRFKDHYRLSKKETEALAKLSEGTKADAVITTEKDEVKLIKKNYPLKDIWVLKISMLIKNIKELEKRLKVQL